MALGQQPPARSQQKTRETKKEDIKAVDPELDTTTPPSLGLTSFFFLEGVSDVSWVNIPERLPEDGMGLVSTQWQVVVDRR
jgi:hypothetical protein